MTGYPFQLLQEHYRLASLAKDKLNQCISPRNTGRRKSEYNLREVVAHANLLDRVLNNIDKIKYEYIQEQENKFRKRSNDFYSDSSYNDKYTYKYNNNIDNSNDNSIGDFDDRLDVDGCANITAASTNRDIYGNNDDDDDDDDPRSKKGNGEDMDCEKEDDFIFEFSDTFPVSPQMDSSLLIPENGYYKCCCNNYTDKVPNTGNDLDHESMNLYPTYLDSVQYPPLSQHIRFPMIHYHKYV